jgi:branched-chain amino acid transport system ATP-binding protein
LRLLTVENLSKRYGAVVVADGVDLTLDLGQCLGIIGPNGAGKSSVFALIAGSVKADAGKILLEGTDVTRLPAYRRARLGIGRAFQIPQPFGGLSVYENVLVAASSGGGFRGRRMVDQAIVALERTGLADKSDRPAGSLTLLDRKALELARALATGGRVLMLDEIGGGLTEREVERLADTIRRLKVDHGIIWIEHIAHALRAVADTILVLNAGRKTLEGPPGTVMDSDVVRDVYMGLKADVAG